MGGGGREQNYWPGFVDALSNVVLTLVFVLVVFVFALLITSGKVQQKTVQMVQQKVEQEYAAKMMMSEVSTKQAETETKLHEAEAKLREAVAARDRLAGEVADLRAAYARLESARPLAQQADRSATPSVIDQRIELRTPSSKAGAPDKETADLKGGAVIVITYPRTTVTLNDKTRAELRKVLDSNRGRIGGTVAKIEATLGAETYSEARRMAYYRALDVRNVLLEHKLVPSSSIAISTKPSSEPGDGKIEIRFVRP